MTNCTVRMKTVMWFSDVFKEFYMLSTQCGMKQRV